MELRPREAASRSSTQGFTNILLKPNVQHFFRKSPPLVPILNQMNPLRSAPSYFSKIHSLLSSHVCLGLRSCFFPSGFPTKILYAYLFLQAC
jgi:hypothetical protein